MAIIALAALATALAAQRYDEVASFVALELGALQPVRPRPTHPYAWLLEVTLRDFRTMSTEELRGWAIGLIQPLEEARRVGDGQWEWLVLSELEVLCRAVRDRRARGLATRAAGRWGGVGSLPLRSARPHGTALTYHSPLRAMCATAGSRDR